MGEMGKFPESRYIGEIGGRWEKWDPSRNFGNAPNAGKVPNVGNVGCMRSVTEIPEGGRNLKI